MTDSASAASDLKGHAIVLRRNWWILVLVVAVGLLVAIGVTSLQSPVYRANMKVVVGQGRGLIQPQFGTAVDPFVQTMASLLKSNIVAETVVRDLTLDVSPERFLEDLKVQTKPNSGVLEVSYDAPSRRQAIRGLQEIGVVFTKLARERLGSGGQGAQITATIFDDAHLQEKQVSPRVVRALGITAVLSLILGIFLALMRGAFDNRIRSRRQAETWFNAAVIGVLPSKARGRRPLSAGSGRSDSRVAAALTLLRAGFEFSSLGKCQSVLITSALPEEGKSTVTANLGVALALAGKSVIVVEADLRRPRLMDYLDLPPAGLGLAEFAAGTLDSSSVLRHVAVNEEWLDRGRLLVIGAGTPAGDPSDILTTERIQRVVSELRSKADVILFDGPPLLLVGDAYPLARTADGVLVVGRVGRTTRESAEAVRKIMHALAPGQLGLVLTDSDELDEYGVSSPYGYEANDGRPRSRRATAATR